MIITRTPMRISFAGGGSDLPAFFEQEPGHVISATIDKYVTIALTTKYDGAVRVSYSKTENVARAAEIEHPLVRACLDFVRIRDGVEIVSIGDIPAGTGLGSSSAFTVGLLAALYARMGEFRPADVLAHEACQIEINRCGQPIGKQDQYAAALGGLRSYTFHPDGGVSTEVIALDRGARLSFQAHLLLLDTGRRRCTTAPGQCADLGDTRARGNVRALANLAQTFGDALRCGRIAECGDILHAAWALKRTVAGGITDDQIDGWYQAARVAGALGGKVCGAGGGGFLLFLAPPDRHAAITQALRLRRVSFSMVDHGTQVIYAD